MVVDHTIKIPDHLELPLLEPLFEEKPAIEYIKLDNGDKLGEIFKNTLDFFAGDQPLNHLYHAQESILPFMVVPELIADESIEKLQDLNNRSDRYKLGLFILYINCKTKDGRTVRVPWDFGTTLHYNDSLIIGPKDTSTNHILFTRHKDPNIAVVVTKYTTSFLASFDHYILSMPTRKDKEKSRTHAVLTAQGFICKDLMLHIPSFEAPDLHESTYHIGPKVSANLEKNNGELLEICVDILDAWNANFQREIVKSPTDPLYLKFEVQYTNTFVLPDDAHTVPAK